MNQKNFQFVLKLQWSDIQRYLGCNDHLKGLDKGRHAPKVKVHVLNIFVKSYLVTIYIELLPTALYGSWILSFKPNFVNGSHVKHNIHAPMYLVLKHIHVGYRICIAVA